MTITPNHLSEIKEEEYWSDFFSFPYFWQANNGGIRIQPDMAI